MRLKIEPQGASRVARGPLHRHARILDPDDFEPEAGLEGLCRIADEDAEPDRNAAPLGSPKDAP